MPHLELDGPASRTSTTELLHPARGVLLDLANSADLRDVVAGWANRVDVVTATPHGDAAASPLAKTDAVLLRPDGHVAWTAPGGDELVQVLRRWFGAPAREWVGAVAQAVGR